MSNPDIIEEPTDIRPPRIRIKWALTTKGAWTPEFTIEGEALGDYPGDRWEIDKKRALEMADQLKAELQSRSNVEIPA